MKPAILLVLTLGAAGLACGAESGTRYVTPTTYQLPAYTPAEAALFDDSISPEVFGLPGERSSPERDPKLIEAAQKADAVVRAKVITVTRDSGGSGLGYTLRLRALGAPYSGTPSEILEVRVSSDNPAVVFIQTSESGFVGKQLVAFVRKYNDKGEATDHYRLEPDTDAVRHAVERAVVLGELR